MTETGPPPSCDFTFHGHVLSSIGPDALFWPARRALILADLHFEKASWYARFGQMLPPYDSAATLERIARLIARCDPAEIWCLGDSFHDGGGPARLDPSAHMALEHMATGRRWTWITGNHDPAPSGLSIGTVMTEATVDGLILRHEAVPGEIRPELSGHFHPKWRVRLRGRSVSRRCFVMGGNRLILPAFGALAGGLDARAAPIARLTGPDALALVPLDDRLLRFKLSMP